jgi:hypothetical protein
MVLEIAKHKEVNMPEMIYIAYIFELVYNILFMCTGYVFKYAALT